jgi:hypothetical protein
MATTKKAPVRRTRTRKAAPKGLNDLVEKPTSRRTRTATQPTKGQVLYANGDSKHRYDGFDNTNTSAYSIAGLELVGLINMTGKSKTLPKATKKDRARADLHDVFGLTMVKHWIGEKWLVETGAKRFKITVVGLNRISDRLENPKDGYRTTPELIAKMTTFLKTGKGLKGHKGDKVTLTA